MAISSVGRWTSALAVLLFLVSSPSAWSRGTPKTSEDVALATEAIMMELQSDAHLALLGTYGQFLTDLDELPKGVPVGQVFRLGSAAAGKMDRFGASFVAKINKAAARGIAKINRIDGSNVQIDLVNQRRDELIADIVDEQRNEAQFLVAQAILDYITG